MPRGKVPKYNTLDKVKGYFDGLGVTVHGLVIEGKRVPFNRVPPQNARVIWGCTVEGCDGVMDSEYRSLLRKCGGKCKPCSGKRGIDYYKKFVDLLKEKGYTMLSKRSEYKNAMDDLMVQCPDPSHPPYGTSLNRFSSNHGCRKCHNSTRKVPSAVVKERYEQKGFILEDNQTYVDNKTPIEMCMQMWKDNTQVCKQSP